MGVTVFFKQFAIGTFAFLAICVMQLNVTGQSKADVALKEVAPQQLEVIEVEEIEIAQNEFNHVQNS